MSSFASLNTALTALRAQRRGLDVTGQNIANANTEGYSRQRVVLESVGAPTTPARYATYAGAGTGVTVTDVERLRDRFLEARGQTEHARQGFHVERQQALGRVEDAFGEPSDTGLQAQLAELWKGWYDVANRPGDSAARGQLLQRAGTLTDSLRTTHASLETQWESTRDRLATVADEVNTTAVTVAQLNQAILRQTRAGEPVNELADRRDQLVLKLADLVGASARPTEDGVVDVLLGGSPLVRGSAAQSLTVVGATRFADAGTDPVRLAFTGETYPAAVESGQAGAHLDVLGTVLPGYAARLDDVAADLAAQVNAIHTTGYDATGAAGAAFFTSSTGGPVTAATIRVGVTSPAGVAASRYGGGAVDGGVAGAVAALASSPTGPDAAYREVVVGLGVDSQTARNRAAIQLDITTRADAARDAHAGVDLDEEMVNMLSFQRAYEGAARVMTAVDQALDKLINSTGVVGR